MTLPAATRRFVYDGDGRVLGEYGASAADVKAEFIWALPQVGASGAFGSDDGIGGYAPLVVATPDSGGTIQLNWIHANHLGVPLVTTDASGAAATTPNDYLVPGFPGQSRTIADLYYNRYRDYDPTTGRYIQGDPIGLEGGNNPYVYAEANPINRVDPLGLQISGPASSLPPPGKCSWVQYWWLTYRKNRACSGDLIQRCKEGMSIEDLTRQIENRMQCIDRRQKIMNQCFGGGDARHKGHVDQMWNGINRCQVVGLTEYGICPAPWAKR